MTSPSFWASTYVNLANGMSWSKAVTTKLQHIHAQALGKLRQTASGLQADLDQKIATARREVAAIR